MIYALFGLAALMGIASTAQGVTNGSMSGKIGLSGTILLNAIVVMVGALSFWLTQPRHEGASLSGIPWYLFLGGAYGICIIGSAAYLFPRIGAGPATAVMIAAQLILALLIDHFGIGTARLPLTPYRLLGALMLIGGAVLVLWPRLQASFD